MTLRNWDFEDVPEIDRGDLADALYEFVESLDVIDRMTDAEVAELESKALDAAETFIEAQNETWRAEG